MSFYEVKNLLALDSAEEWVMELWGAILSAFGAALGGGIAVWLAGALGTRRQAAINIRRAAFACYVRLVKIASAKQPEARDGEVFYLGHDLDVYRDAIGVRPAGYEAHESALIKAVPIIQHDVSHIDEVMEEFRVLWSGK